MELNEYSAPSHLNLAEAWMGTGEIAKGGRFPEMNRVYKEQEFAVLWTDPRLEKNRKAVNDPRAVDPLHLAVFASRRGVMCSRESSHVP